jgi:hypothetical protein
MIQNGQTYRIEGSLEDNRYYNIIYDQRANEFFKMGSVAGSPLIAIAIQSDTNKTDFGFFLVEQRKFLCHNSAGDLNAGDQIHYFGIEDNGDDSYNVRLAGDAVAKYLTMESLTPIQFTADRQPPKQKWKFIISTIDPDKTP